VLLAMTWRHFDSNFKQQVHVRDLAAPFARGLRFVVPRTEGAGNAGCALHPRSRVQRVEENAHEHTGQRRRSDIPCAMALRLISRSCVCETCQNVRTGGSHQPPVAGSEPVRARRPQEPAGERGTDLVSSSTRTVARAWSPNRARKGAG